MPTFRDLVGAAYVLSVVRLADAWGAVSGRGTLPTASA